MHRACTHPKKSSHLRGEILVVIPGNGGYWQFCLNLAFASCRAGERTGYILFARMWPIGNISLVWLFMGYFTWYGKVEIQMRAAAANAVASCYVWLLSHPRVRLVCSNSGEIEFHRSFITILYTLPGLRELLE